MKLEAQRRKCGQTCSLCFKETICTERGRNEEREIWGPNNVFVDALNMVVSKSVFLFLPRTEEVYRTRSSTPPVWGVETSLRAEQAVITLLQEQLSCAPRGALQGLGLLQPEPTFLVANSWKAWKQGRVS